ncbi:MAG: class I SAM-dependent methyltransferase [Burkholderiales bacterium]|jgi:2-polyprenyl-3-methyl-5-hydroxy-6-metoxy-1,4-benzoquinol methylase
MIGEQLAKQLMQFREVLPQATGVEASEMQEIFHHPRFTQGSSIQRQVIMRDSAQAKYNSEMEYPWDNYFGMDLHYWLNGKRALDLGCFTGGRGVAWAERYGLQQLLGVDVSEPFIQAASQFAASRGVAADFRLATAERLPFDDASVDAVLSFDVMEHVQDVARALKQCERVLKPGGLLFLVFPGYYQPIEHHLSMVTRTPGLQYFFSGPTLLKAYCKILKQRGSAADWYGRDSNFKPWERGNTINGTTLAQFKRHLRDSNWRIVRHVCKPIGTIGRNATKSGLLKTMSVAFYPLARIPVLQEIFLHRITYILQKRA